MNDSSWRDEIASKVLQLQIIVGALVAGCVIFGVIAVDMVNLGGQPDDAGQPDAAEQLPLLTYIALFFGITSLFSAWIVPSIMVGKARLAILNGTWQPPQGPQGVAFAEFIERCGDAGRLWILFITRTIIRAAIIEGAAFFLLVAYMIEHSPIALIAAIVWTFFVAVQFPSRARAVHWIEDQVNMLEQQRQFGG